MLVALSCFHCWPLPAGEPPPIWVQWKSCFGAALLGFTAIVALLAHTDVLNRQGLQTAAGRLASIAQRPHLPASAPG